MHSTQHSALDENISAQLSVLSSDLLVILTLSPVYFTIYE